jgi:hypothetical protein
MGQEQHYHLSNNQHGMGMRAGMMDQGSHGLENRASPKKLGYR